MPVIKNPHPECRAAGGCKDQIRLAEAFTPEDRTLLGTILDNYIEE